MYKRIALILVFLLLFQLGLVYADTSGQSQGDIKSQIDYNLKIGVSFIQLGKFDEAIKYFDESIRTVGSNCYAYYYKAIALMALGKKTEAAEALIKSVEADRNSAKPIGVIEYANAEPIFDAIRDCEVFKNNNTVGNTVGNLNNEGFAATQNGWIYYYNRENGGITRIDEKGSKIRLKNGNAWYINVVEGWVYFSEIVGSFNKIKTDGSREVILDEIGASYINVIGDWIYYTGGGYGKKCIYRMKTDGSSKTIVCKDDAVDLNIIGSTIYYANQKDNNKVYKVGIDGKGRVKINDDNTNCITVVDNRIFYVNTKDYCVYSTDLNGKNKIKVNNIKTLFMNINDGWIYFSNMNDMDKLYKIKPDGTGLTKLNDNKSGQFSIVGDWIYYTNGDDSNNNIFRIKKDGTNNTLVN